MRLIPFIQGSTNILILCALNIFKCFKTQLTVPIDGFDLFYYCDYITELHELYYPSQVPGLSVEPLNANPTAETIEPELKKLKTV